MTEKFKQKAKNYAWNYPIPYSLYEKIEDKKEQMGEVIEQAYLDGAEEVKADCDFALEGKDVEIKELKEVLKGLLEEEEKGLWFKADGSDKSRYYKLREKAEQFLKE